MSIVEKLKSVWDSKRKTVIIVASSVLAALFIGSILLAIFIGGEFKSDAKKTYDVKGVMMIDTSECKTDYVVGDLFEFDKDAFVVKVKVKEPEKEVYEEELDGADYGFLVNGEGKRYNDASEIVMKEDTKFVRVVWTQHENFKVDIAVNVAQAAE